MLAFVEGEGIINFHLILLLVAAIIASLVIFCYFLFARNGYLKLEEVSREPHVQTSHGWGSLLNHGLSVSSIRDANLRSIVQLRTWGASHHLLYTPAPIRAFANLRPSVVGFTSIKWKISNKAFGIPSEYKEAFTTASKDLDRCIVEYLLQEPHVSDISRAAITNARDSVGKLITTSFNPDAGPGPWERYASCKLRISRDLDSTFEVSLFPLLTSFMGHMTLPIIFGKAFVANSPNVVEDIDLLDDSFSSMIIGLPRWLPIPSLKRAYEARDRLQHDLACLYSSLDKTALGLDPGPDWRDLSDVSQLVKDFDAIWMNVGLSVPARAAAGLGILWGLTINANNALFWLLLRIYATAGLAEQIRDETKAFFIGTSGEIETSLTASGIGNIGRSCVMLKACYLETLRLDGEVRSIRKVRKETFIPASEDVASDIAHQLHPGDYIHTLYYLHHQDPKFFPDPQSFKPERFLIRKGNDTKVNQGTLRPYGAGISICKGRIIAERVILYTVAAILHCWDIEPADSAVGWKIPHHVSAAGVCKPKEDVRVVIRRRSQTVRV